MSVEGVNETLGSKQTKGEGKGVSPRVEQGQRAQGPESPKGRNFPWGLMNQHISRRGDWSQLGKGLGLELVIMGILEVQVPRLGVLES